MLRIVLAVMVFLAIAGCGDPTDPEAATGPATLPARTAPSEQEVLDHARIVEGCDTWGKITLGPCTKMIEGTDEIEGIPTIVHKPSGCEVSMILTGPDAVATYVGNGTSRVIATDPAQVVGVELDVDRNDEPRQAERCHTALTAALAELPRP